MDFFDSTVNPYFSACLNLPRLLIYRNQALMIHGVSSTPYNITNSNISESYENFRCSDNLPQLVRPVLASVPAPHDVQQEAPEEELYVPAAHDVQEEAPKELYVPAAHDVQEEAPKELYFPGAHLAQEDMLELLY